MGDGNEDFTVEVGILPIATPSTTGRENPCLVVLSGGPIGLMRPLVAGEATLIGRTPEAQLRLDDRTVSRQHARVTVEPTVGVVIEDLKSTNGTIVNGQRVQRQLLRDGDRIQLGPKYLIKFCYQDAVEKNAQEEMFVRGIKDGLTGSYNKQYFLERLETEYLHAKRAQQGLALLIFDIDHFKQINDSHGHPAGDTVLRDFVRIVSTQLRAEDIFARYGGDEFVLLSRDVADAGAVVIAQRLRRALKQHRFVADDRVIAVAVSIGVATMEDNVRRGADLLKLADKHLYQAKQAGRNRLAGGPGVMAAMREIAAARMKKIA